MTCLGTRNRKQSGVGLIEILITIFILSIGFLAAARMQIEGMRFSQSAYFQSQAYFLANDIINRMRTNQVGVLDGYYNGVSTSASATDPGCSNKLCEPALVALQDTYDWSSYFHARNNDATFVAALPSSDTIQAKASIQSLSDELFSVQLVWSEIISGEYEEQSLAVNFALQRRDSI